MTETIQTTLTDVTREEAELVLRVIRQAIARGENPATVAGRLHPREVQIMQAILDGIGTPGNA